MEDRKKFKPKCITNDEGKPIAYLIDPDKHPGNWITDAEYYHIGRLDNSLYLDLSFLRFYTRNMTPTREAIVDIATNLLLKRGFTHVTKGDFIEVVGNAVAVVIYLLYQESKGINIEDDVRMLNTTFHKDLPAHLCRNLFNEPGFYRPDDLLLDHMFQLGINGELYQEVRKHFWPADNELFPPVVKSLILDIMTASGDFNDSGSWRYDKGKQWIIRALYHVLRDEGFFFGIVGAPEKFVSHMSKVHGAKISTKSLNTIVTSSSAREKEKDKVRDLTALIKKYS